ncbi:unnamed protein product, partial [Allacma fusca]
MAKFFAFAVIFAVLALTFAAEEKAEIEKAGPGNCCWTLLRLWT